MNSKFVNLDVASAFSFLWGTFTPDELVKKVKADGQEAVALADIWGTYGIPRFFKACRRHGIQCIPGARLEIYGQGWVVLLASDLKGYGNLCRILSSSIRRGPRRFVTAGTVRELSTGLVCITGVLGSAARSLAIRGNREGTGIKLLALRDIFRHDRTLYVGMQQNFKTDTDANALLLEQAQRLGLPAVAVNHAAFLKTSEHAVHRMLADIQRKHHHREISPLPGDSFHVCSEHDMRSRGFGDSMISACSDIAAACRGFSFPSGRLHPPVFRKKARADRELSRKAVASLASRGDAIPARYIFRLQKELSIVKHRGLSDFFLLVHEICRLAQQLEIRHSIRGSAAGSLLVHLLHGGPDPVAHDLLFERFINYGRHDLPDIDIDFDSERRDEITQWLIDCCNTGHEHSSRVPYRQAALVATISKFRVRSAVRLAARAMGYPLREIDRLGRCLPWSLRGIPLSEALERLPELKHSPLRYEKTLVRMAASIEGLPYQPSVHLGGVILAPRDICDWTALSVSRKGLPVAHLDKDDVDLLGLLKLDLLGLRMHTAIRKAVAVLEKEGVILDPDTIPLHDPVTFDLLCSGDTLGVFQLESSGQRNLIGRLQPADFNDISVEISLFRPGPVQGDMVERYLRRRAGRERTDFLHPDLKDILEETSGVIVFQEQVLRIVHRFAGFSYADADAFRRAMTKNRSSGEMRRLKHAFIQGAIDQGYDLKTAEYVYEKIAAFAAYGFCKAHAVAFAHITWQSAWLKAHHPEAFYTGLLNAGHVGSYPPFVILNEARRKGIPTLPPHVNISTLEYLSEDGSIRCPLQVIRGIGKKTAEKIITERQRSGPYTGWDDFFARVQLPALTRHNLIFSGALEGLPAGGHWQDGDSDTICAYCYTDRDTGADAKVA